MNKKEQIILFLCSLTPILFINNHINWGGDFALYINQSIHLINGNLNNLYNEQLIISQYQRLGPYFYPMGVPLIISPIIYFFGLNIFALKLYGILFWIGSLWFLKKYLAFFFEKSIIFNVLLVTQFSFIYHQILDTVVSDIYFFFFFNFFVFIFFKRKKTFNYFFLLGFLMFALSIIRSTGLLIVILFTLYTLIKFINKREVISFLPLLIFATFYFFYLKIFNYDFDSNQTNHAFQFLNTDTFINNILYYSKEISGYLSGGLFKLIDHEILIFALSIIITIPLVYFFLVRFYYEMKSKNENFITLFILAVFYVGFHILMPFRNGIRFLFPVLPLILIILFQNTNKKIFQLIFFIQFFTLISAGIYYKTDIRIKSNNSEMMQVYKYIDCNLNGENILFKKPRVLNLFTKSKALPLTKETKKMFNYALLVKDTGEENLNLWKTNKVLYETKNTKLIKICH